MIFPAVLLVLAGLLGWLTVTVDDPNAAGMFCFSALVLVGCAIVRYVDNRQMRSRP